ncbi:cyanophycinase [Pollutimonas subterranea]|nr:cyanophycinase [Pollutimonas subterranea]
MEQINTGASMQEEHAGALLIVGGSEERHGDMQVLSKFVELCGGPDSAIVVLTAATSVPDKIWAIYDAAFAELGVSNRAAIHIGNRREADDADAVAQILRADGIFISGGEQQRLLASIGGSKVHETMHRAFRERGACIGGTSAGASAISRHMMAYGTKDMLPNKNSAQLDVGLGFLQHVVIDQHFSERHRLARLLSAVAQDPDVIGLGIDEDTAVVIRDRGWLEVVGTGAVTILDGRRMTSNFDEANPHQQLELIDVRLHLLPAGSHYNIGRTADAPAALRNVLALVTEI